MALELSIEAEAFLQQTNIVGNIILDIKGFDDLYGSVKVTRVANIGEFVIGDGTIIGGSIDDPNSKDYISLTGTTNNITQKLNQDKGGSSSITTFKVRLIDKNNELTRAFSPGVTVSDILGTEAIVYWQAKGSKHPQSSARLFVGVISSAFFGQSYIDVRIDHPEQLKRQDVLPKITGELTANLNAGVTACLVNTTEGVVSPQDNLTSYVRINDEIIKIIGVTSAGFLSMERGQFGTTDTNHSSGDQYETFYQLQGNPIELALKMMLSGQTGAFFDTAYASRFNLISPSIELQGAIFFNEPNIADRLGLVVGDKVAVISGASAGNLVSYREILSTGTTDTGSYVVIDYAFTTEIELEALCYFKSKYDTLSFGAGLKPSQVDVAQFESLLTTFSTQFFTYDYYLKDTVNLKTFIDEKLFYPSALFSIPRKGRISVGISAPPILGANAKTLDSSNITNASQVGMARSINDAFYNSIAFKFNEDAIEDKLLSATIVSSEDSFNRVNIGPRTLTIEAGGIRDTADNRNKIQSIATRFLDRYQFGAEKINVSCNFGTAFVIEVGDTVILDGSTIGLADITQGSRDFLARVMEVTNKSINLKTGKASLELTDTNLSSRARYGVFAPSSYVGSGSTTTSIVIKRSFGTTEAEFERDKWSDYVLQGLQVRSADYSTIYTTRLVGFSGTNPNILNIAPAITAPIEDMIVELVPYDDTSAQTNRISKALHGFVCPQVEATGGTTSTFTVDSGDVAKFFVGCAVQIHLADYSESDTTYVTEISGTTITINKTLSFTITSSHLIDAIGFAGDEGEFFAYY